MSAIASREIARDKICTFSLPLASGGQKLLPLQGSLPLRLVELLALLGGVLVGPFAGPDGSQRLLRVRRLGEGIARGLRL